MRQFFKFFFASLLAMLVAIMVFFIVVFGIIGSLKNSISNSFKIEEKVYKQRKSVLTINLAELYSEIGHINSMAIFTGGSSSKAGIYELTEGIKKAKNDDDIQAILIKTGGWHSGIAIAEQIREALADFKESNKMIYAYGDYITQNDYFIASMADKIYVNPLGGLEIKGLSSQLMFFKGTLDKLGVAPEIFYAGQFKSATEPFRLKKMSDPNRVQLAAMQSIIWQQYLEAFSAFSGLTPEEINEFAQNGLLETAEDAQKASLITDILYLDEVEDILKEQVGLEKKQDLRTIDLFDYAKEKSTKSSNQQIAVLFAEGTIVDGEGNGNDQIADVPFIEQLRAIKDNDQIKGLVIRINSGGGSALASEKMLREIKLLQEKIPVVVSMGNVAASGGYYMAASADSIFAQPSTITGSIGVFGMMFNLSQLLEDKIGITFDVEKNAPHADLPNLMREMNASEKAIIQRSVDRIYDIFKNRVAEGRKMTLEYVDSIGQGRVWMGTTALELGLVDALGGTNRAIESAANLAGISDYQVAIFPKKDDKLDQFLKGLSSGGIEQKLLEQNILAQELGVDYKWFKFLRNLQLHRNSVLMMMPYEVYFE